MGSYYEVKAMEALISARIFKYSNFYCTENTWLSAIRCWGCIACKLPNLSLIYFIPAQPDLSDLLSLLGQ